MWRVPYATSPSMMMAAPFMRTELGVSDRHTAERHDTRTPVTNALRLFLTCVEHAGDNHESRRDGALTDAEECTAGEELPKVLGGCMRQQCDCPHKDVQADPNQFNCTLVMAETGSSTNLIHLPTGRYWSARFCGHSKARKKM